MTHLFDDHPTERENEQGKYQFKADQGKSRVDLLSPQFILALGDVMRFGASKYSEESWRKVPEGQKRYYAAAMRHLLDWKGGERINEESGLPHLAHAAVNIMFLAELEGD